MCVYEGVGLCGVVCMYILWVWVWVSVCVCVCCAENKACIVSWSKITEATSSGQSSELHSGWCLSQRQMSTTNCFFRNVSAVYLIIHLTDSWSQSSCVVPQCLKDEPAPNFRHHWLPLQFMSLLFWLACWPVGPLVSRLDIVGLCAIRCSVNVLIKLSVFCNVLGHLPSAESVLLLPLLLLHFNCFYFTICETAEFTERKTVCLWLFAYVPVWDLLWSLEQHQYQTYLSARKL